LVSHACIKLRVGIVGVECVVLPTWFNAYYSFDPGESHGDTYLAFVEKYSACLDHGNIQMSSKTDPNGRRSEFMRQNCRFECPGTSGQAPGRPREAEDIKAFYYTSVWESWGSTTLLRECKTGKPQASFHRECLWVGHTFVWIVCFTACCGAGWGHAIYPFWGRAQIPHGEYDHTTVSMRHNCKNCNGDSIPR